MNIPKDDRPILRFLLKVYVVRSCINVPAGRADIALPWADIPYFWAYSKDLITTGSGRFLFKTLFLTDSTPDSRLMPMEQHPALERSLAISSVKVLDLIKQ